MQELVEEPWKFDFFQAVRLLHQVAFQSSSTTGTRPLRSVGGVWRPEDEVVQFHAQISFGFPSAEISRAKVIGSGAFDDAPAEIQRFAVETTFMAIGGTSGVLPQHYTHCGSFWTCSIIELSRSSIERGKNTGFRSAGSGRNWIQARERRTSLPRRSTLWLEWGQMR